MTILFWKNLFKCLPCQNPHSLTHFEEENEEEEEYQEDMASSKQLPPPTITESFNTLYDLTNSPTTTNSSPSSTTSISDSDMTEHSDTLPDISTIFASRRFFFTSPGRSNSIVDSLNPSHDDQEPQTLLPFINGGGHGVAIKKYSPNPYQDFKISMQEMIEARRVTIRNQTKNVYDNNKADCEYLHELLSCYLTLNPKSTHTFIISAFADIVICLLYSPESGIIRKHDVCRRLNDVSSYLV